MPTYEYRCDACGHAWELFQSMKDSPVKKCPSCGKAKAQRLIGTGAAILFKGSGFYQTDYRSESYKNAAKADSGGNTAAAAEKSAPAGKTDSTTGSPAAQTSPGTPPAAAASKAASDSGKASNKAPSTTGEAGSPTSRSTKRSG